MATATTTPPRTPHKAGPAAPTTFRLLLSIGGTVYWVRPITSALHAKAFRLRRADGQGEHYVTQDEHGTTATAATSPGGTRAGGRPASTSGPCGPRGCSTAPRRPRRRRRAGSGTSSTRPDRHRPRGSNPGAGPLRDAHHGGRTADQD
jgi:hypothetical protein